MLAAMARVLVIDDEPDVRWLIRVSLERAGHEVLVAEDGLRGVAVAMKQRPEAMTCMNGPLGGPFVWLPLDSRLAPTEA